MDFLSDSTTLIIGFVVFFVVLYFMKSKKSKNYPPGPTGLPLVGYMPFLDQNPGETFLKLKGKYGTVMSVRVGRDDWIVLNDFDAINDALVKQPEVFSGRGTNDFFDMITGGQGIVMADYGETWKTLRKFGTVTLRGFGVGKKSMEANIIEETPFLIEILTSEKGPALKTKIGYAVSNIISRVTFGSRFAYDDKDFVELLRIMNESFGDTIETKLLELMTMASFLKHLPYFRSALKRAMEEYEKFLDIFKKIADEHMKSFDKNDIRDFTDAFIKEMKQQDGDDKIYNHMQLLQYIRDLFEAGTGTTNAMLTWMMLCFAHYPECQEKIAKEVHDVIGESGVPTMKHREEMPYTCAFIQEILRHRTLVPLSVLHKASKDTTLYGYDIPKDTVIVPNIWGVHYDPNLFENPTEFRPERFLDEDGKFVKSKHVIPFSVGPRHCIGVHLAGMELFIFLTGIVQKLRVLPDPDHPLPDFSSGIFSLLVYESHDFKVKFEKR